ncbi:MAG TPA: FtsX-like permease family protein, partial [Longimicrobiales bacterium]
MRQKMDSIAILKCLGARSNQVLRIYAAQTAMLGIAGGLLGILFGVAVERIFPLLIARIGFLPDPPPLGWDPVPAAQGLAIALATTLLFTIPPLLGIRGIKPNVILRREMAETAARRRWKPVLASGALILTGIAAIAAWLVEADLHQALRIGAYFAVALAVALAVLAGIARALLAGLQAVQRRAHLPAVLRHGLANLYRPGAHATAVLVALGVGVMFTLTVYLIETSLVSQIAASMPPGVPNVFLVDIPAADRQALTELAARQPGVLRPPEIMAAVALRLATVDGIPVERLALRGHARHFLRTRSVTWLREKPAGALLAAGAWWDPAHPPGEPQVSAEEEAALALGLRPGSSLVFQAWGRTIRATVASIHRPEAIRMSMRFEFIFSPGVLEGFPAVYYGGMRVEPRAVPALQRVLYERFPTVTVINVADVLEIVQQVVDRIAAVYRFLSLFTILAGAVILASSVAGTRFRRIREAAILKALGATRRRVA